MSVGGAGRREGGLLPLSRRAGTVLFLVGLAALSGRAEERAPTLPALEASAREAACRDPRGAAFARQLRGAGAFADLGPRLSLPPGAVTVVYPASGSHLAPLALCEADGGRRSYRFLYFDSDETRGGEIAEGLARLAAEGGVTSLREEEEGAGRVFRFRLGGHPVELRFQATPPEDPMAPLEGLGGNLAGVSVVLVHDWSGDPYENLELLYRYVRLLRKARPEKPPLLVLEDLRRHPYPVDLALFSPVAHSARPYGHRGPAADCRGEAELGAPLFGGAVVLSFQDRWWERASEADLPWIFDFLWFSLCDEERRNVLGRDPDPVLAPWPADWAAGYGSRSVTGTDIRTLAAFRMTLLRKARGAEGLFGPGLRSRWRSLLELYRAALRCIAAGAPAGTLALPSRFREAGGEAVPALREALERGEALAPERARWAEARKEEAKALLLAFPGAGGFPSGGPSEDGAACAAYRKLKDRLFPQGEGP